ncbi:Acrosin-Binding Protein [Manis pentadactyla]|nr:Acrosin-Binding Protein [Manis pentadactyla]
MADSPRVKHVNGYAHHGHPPSGSLCTTKPIICFKEYCFSNGPHTTSSPAPAVPEQLQVRGKHLPITPCNPWQEE